MTVKRMYKGKNKEIYGELEETILSCLLIEPTLIDSLKVSEKHFEKFGYILTFFKEFYKKHQCLDITLMYSELKGSSQVQFMDLITYLTEIFVIPTHFEKYQNKLIEKYATGKKDKWLSGKIYDKATKLYMGSISVNEFYSELKKLNEYANKIDWRQ